MSNLGLDDRTTRLICGKRVWDELTPILLPYSKSISAAIAYIGPEAAHHLPITAGSSIIVDASEHSVRSGSTDPRVLLAWLEGGVKVYSLNNLHAKMILAEGAGDSHDRFLAVGSSNASDASATRLYESMILTDNDETLDEARDSLIQWKTLAGGPITIQQLKALIEIYAVDRLEPTPEPDGDIDTDPEPDTDRTPWPRPTSVYVAPITLDGEPSEEAVHQGEKLARDFGCADEDQEDEWFAITMFWWDENNDPSYDPNWKYAEGAHIIAVHGTKSGQMRASSKLTEPGRVVHSYTETDGAWSRTYYYMHTKLSDEVHTLSELKGALASAKVDLDYASRYIRPRVIDALLGIWTDIDYTPNF